MTRNYSLQNGQFQKFLVTIFSSFFFFGLAGSVRIGHLKISRHYFFSSFSSSSSSFFFFFFFSKTGSVQDKTAENFSSLNCFFFFPLYLYITRGIVVKKWQENIDKMSQFRMRQLKISRHYFLLLFFLLVYLLETGPVQDKTAEDFSSLRFFFFFFLSLAWLGLFRIRQRWKFLVTKLFFLFSSFLYIMRG